LAAYIAPVWRIYFYCGYAVTMTTGIDDVTWFNERDRCADECYAEDTKTASYDYGLVPSDRHCSSDSCRL